MEFADGIKFVKLLILKEGDYPRVFEWMHWNNLKCGMGEQRKSAKVRHNYGREAQTNAMLLPLEIGWGNKPNDTGSL